MNRKPVRRSLKHCGGYSVTELLIVVVVMAIIAGVSLPQIISARRLMRFNGLAREISAQIRFARQQAISQRQVFRFRYNDVSKQIVIIDNQEPGTPTNPLANDTSNDVIVKTIPLGATGVPSSELRYGRPSGAGSSDNLSDGTTRTALVNNEVEIIFQPDGSVLNASGTPVSTALFFYNVKDPSGTANAISVLGAAGRVKIWRYSKSANSYIN